MGAAKNMYLKYIFFIYELAVVQTLHTYQPLFSLLNNRPNAKCPRKCAKTHKSNKRSASQYFAVVRTQQCR